MEQPTSGESLSTGLKRSVAWRKVDQAAVLAANAAAVARQHRVAQEILGHLEAIVPVSIAGRVDKLKGDDVLPFRGIRDIRTPSGHVIFPVEWRR
jgi:hypothetical protein